MFPADEIIVIVAGPDSTKFTYSSPIPKGCPPGKSGLTLFCPVGVPIIHSKITFPSFRYRRVRRGFSFLSPVKYDPLICYFNQITGKVQIRDKPLNLPYSAYLAIYSPWMCEYFNLIAVRHVWSTGSFNHAENLVMYQLNLENHLVLRS